MLTEEERIQKIKDGYFFTLKDYPQEEITYKMCVEAVLKDARAFRFVPADLVTEEICLIAGVNNPKMLKLAPDAIFTPDFCKALIQKTSPDIVVSFPETVKKASIYLDVLDDYPDVFWWIPKKARTKQVCIKALKALGYSTLVDAVNKDPDILGLMPKSMYDHDSSLAFITSHHFLTAVKVRRVSVLSDELDVFEKPFSLDGLLQWEDVCEFAVEAYPEILKKIPEKFQTLAVQIKAVEADGTAIRYVPVDQRTPDLCEIAFHQSPWSMEFFPECCITPQMCEEAVRESQYLIQYVPDNLKTPEICRISCDLYYIPSELIDKSMALDAVRGKGELRPQFLSYVPIEMRDFDVCLAAVETNGYNLSFVPVELMSETLIWAAMEQTSAAFSCIPDKLKTPELCLFAVKRYPLNFKHVPKEKMTEEICLIALLDRMDKISFAEIPKECITYALCLAYIKEKPYYINRIPEQFLTEEILLISLKKYDDAVEYIPESLRESKAFMMQVDEIQKEKEQKMLH